MSWIPGCLEGATRGELADNDWECARLESIDREHDRGTERDDGDDDRDWDAEYADRYGDDPRDGDGSSRGKAP